MHTTYEHIMDTFSSGSTYIHTQNTQNDENKIISATDRAETRGFHFTNVQER